MSSRADELALIVCQTSNAQERTKCESELSSIIDQDPIAVLGNTTSPYTLVCCSVLVVQLFKKRRHEGGVEFAQSFLEAMLNVVEDLFSHGEAVPAFALRAIVTALVKIQKLSIDGWDQQKEGGSVVSGSSILGRAAGFLSPGLSGLGLGGSMDPTNKPGGGGEEQEQIAPCQLVQMIFSRIEQKSKQNDNNNSTPGGENNNNNNKGQPDLHYIRIFAELVDECSKYDASKANSFMGFSAHRRASTLFRDASLRLLVPFALDALRSLVFEYQNEKQQNNNNNNNNNNNSKNPLTSSTRIAAICDLINNCFNYDFMAIVVDETEETFVTQYPTDWRQYLLETRDALDIIRDAHLMLPLPHATTLLRAIIGLIGARRSFFVEPSQKCAWLDFFMQVLMASSSGENASGSASQKENNNNSSSSSSDRRNDVVYCAVLAEAIQRFIPPHTYQDLAECPNWNGAGGDNNNNNNNNNGPSFIEWVAEFSRAVFALPFGQGGNLQTMSALLTFWNRCINSKRLFASSQNPPPQDLEVFVPELMRVFLQTRLTQADNDLDEDGVTAVTSQTELLPSFFSVRTTECLQGIASMMSEAGEKVINSHPSTLLWACHTGACLVKSLVPHVVEDTCAPLAQFIRVMCQCCQSYLNQRTPGSFAELEHAVIAYLTSLQTVFTSLRLSPAVTNLLKDVFGEKHNLFQFLLDCVGANITSDRLDTETIDGSLDLIIEACADLPTPQLMQLSLDIPPVVNLPMSRSVNSYKLRAKLYHALYIVRLPDPFGIDDFHRFLMPILELMRSAERDPLFVGGWLRDLRGCAAATSNSEGAFAELLEWLLQNSDVFYNIAMVDNLPSIVSDSLLKFLRQLVTPPRQTGTRLNIPGVCHSPAGLLLMQFCMRIVTDVLTRLQVPQVVTQAVSEDRDLTASEADSLYENYLKHIQTAMNVAKLCVNGDFCPFGAMQLYQDNRFSDAVVGIVRMTSGVPIKLLKEFPHVAGTLSQLLQCLVHHHLTSTFLQMDNAEIQFIIDFALSVCGDTETRTPDLAVALDFLSWVASTRPVIEREDPTNGAGRIQNSASPRFVMRQVRYLFGQKLRGLGLQVYDMIASCAMNIVVNQDRCMPQASACAYPIFDTDPDAFSRYATFLTGEYARPFHKAKVSEMLGDLVQDVQTQDRFFAKLLEFRGKLRELGL